MYVLYYKPTCPYSRKVVDFAVSNNVELELRDVKQLENSAELERVSGKQQVPYLVDTDRNVAMPESGDIVEYLKQRLASEVAG